MRYRRVVALVHILVNPKVFVEHFQRGFKAPGDLIATRSIQAFVVCAMHGKKNRKICGSVAVAQRAQPNKMANIMSPPRKLPRRLNVAAPITRARKKSVRSAPQIV